MHPNMSNLFVSLPALKHIILHLPCDLSLPDALLETLTPVKTPAESSHGSDLPCPNLRHPSFVDIYFELPALKATVEKRINLKTLNLNASA
ncbi:hypothetical protein BDV98DRAFT_560241 [Pterulicium gracile]|uniref:Uncharacterized protein n=1 Tax=Pterulicium gracile TaxID=1884261 RepID=A0A5C3QZ47_9AGAR|nr:hypothetical protein BDV98DRAFT_560241 [Pterula gracilis]